MWLILIFQDENSNLHSFLILLFVVISKLEIYYWNQFRAILWVHRNNRNNTENFFFTQILNLFLTILWTHLDIFKWCSSSSCWIRTVIYPSKCVDIWHIEINWKIKNNELIVPRYLFDFRFLIFQKHVLI